MAILQNGSIGVLDTPRLPPVALPLTTTQRYVLRQCLYDGGSRDLSGWEITIPFDFQAVNEDWDAPASFPRLQELTIWIPGWQQAVIVFARRFAFVTVRDVLDIVHRTAQRSLVPLANASLWANQTGPAGLGLLLGNAPAPYSPVITAPGRRWAGLTAPSDNAEHWVLALV